MRGWRVVQRVPASYAAHHYGVKQALMDREQNTMDSGPSLLRPNEVARQLGLGRSKIYQLMQAGELRPVHIGRAVRIPAAEVAAYVARLQAEAPSGR